jgi:hypothetical protein
VEVLEWRRKVDADLTRDSPGRSGKLRSATPSRVVSVGQVRRQDRRTPSKLGLLEVEGIVEETGQETAGEGADPVDTPVGPMGCG